MLSITARHGELSDLDHQRLRESIRVCRTETKQRHESSYSARAASLDSLRDTANRESSDPIAGLDEARPL